MLDIINNALSKEPQEEPAEFMGTFSMGPGSHEDVPLSDSETTQNQSEFEKQNG